MILDCTSFKSFQRARLLHVAAAALLTIPAVLGMRLHHGGSCRRRLPTGDRRDQHLQTGYEAEDDNEGDCRSRGDGKRHRRRGRGSNQVAASSSGTSSEASEYMESEDPFIAFPPIVRGDDVYYIDQDGVPRHSEDKGVLTHPLAEEIHGSIGEWMDSLSSKKKEKALRKTNVDWLAWMADNHLNDNTEVTSEVLWKLEANLKKLMNNSGCDVPISSYQHKYSTTDLCETGREEERKRKRKRSLDLILSGPAEYANKAKWTALINKHKRSSKRYSYLSLQETVYYEYQFERDDECPARIASELLEIEKRNGDTRADEALSRSGAELDFRLREAARRAYKEAYRRNKNLDTDSDWSLSSSSGDYSSSSTGSASDRPTTRSKYLENVKNFFLQSVGVGILAAGAAMTANLL